jgi:hypothetical protein
MAHEASGYSIDDDLTELRVISESLTTCTDPDEQDDLLARQAELRSRWAPKLTDLSTPQLLERKQQLQIRLKEAARGKFDTAGVSGSERGGGFDPVQTLKHNRKIDEQNGRAELDADLAEVLEILDRRRRT